MLGEYANPDCKIRMATIDECWNLPELLDAYRVFYSAKSNLSLSKDHLVRLITGRQIVIGASNEVRRYIGFCTLFPSLSSVSACQIFILNDLFVDPNKRRLGIGQALLSYAEQVSAANGVKKLTLETSKSNLAAKSLYEKAGWQLMTVDSYAWDEVE